MKALRLATLPWNADEDGDFVVALQMVEFDNADISLPDGTMIRRRTNHDEAIWNRLDGVSAYLELSDYVASTTTSGKTFYDAEQKARARFDALVTCLRLLGAAPVRLGDGFGVQQSDPSSARPVSFWYRSGLPALWKVLPHTLSRGIASDIDELYGKLRAPTGRLRVAIARFDAAYTRSAPEDEFLDVWIALEALFSPDDRYEFRHRIPLRVAYFIGESADERETIYVTLKNSYDLRSKVVHGSELTAGGKKKKETAGKIAFNTREYLQRSLRKILLSAGQFDPDLLDSLIARGGEGA